VDVSHSSSTKRRPRQIFKDPPQKRTKDPIQAQAVPTNSASWMAQPWLAPASTQQQQWTMGQSSPWMMGQPGLWMMGPQYPGPWMQPQTATTSHVLDVPAIKPESEARAKRRANRKEMEEKVDARQTQRQKPHRVRVKAGGG
jgi:hypothetical protein